jgi:hypothetical protein
VGPLDQVGRVLLANGGLYGVYVQDLTRAQPLYYPDVQPRPGLVGAVVLVRVEPVTQGDCVLRLKEELLFFARRASPFLAARTFQASL